MARVLIRAAPVRDSRQSKGARTLHSWKRYFASCKQTEIRGMIHDLAVDSSMVVASDLSPKCHAGSPRPNPTSWLKQQVLSSAQGNCSAKSLAGTVMSSILPCPPCLGAGGSGRGRGSSGGRGRGGGWRRGEEGRGHFIHLAIYCTTTWCFALKGLRTIRCF